jgi:hypothetical protein
VLMMALFKNHSSKPLQVTHGHGHNLAKVPKYEYGMMVPYQSGILIFFLNPSDQKPVFPSTVELIEFTDIKMISCA